jgi:hypothetical protein
MQTIKIIGEWVFRIGFLAALLLTAFIPESYSHILLLYIGVVAFCVYAKLDA